jgi:hypothetical protein
MGSATLTHPTLANPRHCQRSEAIQTGATTRRITGLITVLRRVSHPSHEQDFAVPV